MSSDVCKAAFDLTQEIHESTKISLRDVHIGDVVKLVNDDVEYEYIGLYRCLVTEYDQLTERNTSKPVATMPEHFQWQSFTSVSGYVSRTKFVTWRERYVLRNGNNLVFLSAPKIAKIIKKTETVYNATEKARLINCDSSLNSSEFVFISPRQIKNTDLYLSYVPVNEEERSLIENGKMVGVIEDENELGLINVVVPSVGRDTNNANLTVTPIYKDCLLQNKQIEPVLTWRKPTSKFYSSQYRLLTDEQQYPINDVPSSILDATWYKLVIGEDSTNCSTIKHVYC
jgi:hypothetical protein